MAEIAITGTNSADITVMAPTIARISMVPPIDINTVCTSVFFTATWSREFLNLYEVVV